MNQLFQFLKSFLDLNGTASRKRGWLVFGAMVAAYVATALARDKVPALMVPLFLVFGATLIIWIVTLVQRLHDTGRSGYWGFTAIVPLLGLVAVPTILLLPKRDIARRGHPIARRFGMAGLALLGLFFISRAFLWHPYWIPSEAMKPTLLVGDYIVTTKVSEASLQRGDILVFRHPVTGQDYIKRLIGLPGDTVQMRDGVVILNGVALPQTADGSFDEVMGPEGPMASRPRCANGAVEDGAMCSRPRFVETMPDGSSHAILNIDDGGYADNTDVFSIPEGQLFFMGDNRDNSMDSRFSQTAGGAGFVPIENVQGKARLIVYSSAGRSMSDVLSWRAGRYWLAVK